MLKAIEIALCKLQRLIILLQSLKEMSKFVISSLLLSMVAAFSPASFNGRLVGKSMSLKAEEKQVRA
jgi:hypothetical protein